MTVRIGKDDGLRIGGALALGIAMGVLGGCAGGVVTGTAYATGGAATVAMHEEQEELDKKLGEDYQEYQELFSASRCDPDEYEIAPGIMESLEDTPPAQDGFEETQDTLAEVYHNVELDRDVRAHALYLMALAEAQKEEGSREQARDYLRRVKQEFPGTHDCAVDVLLERGRTITDETDSDREEM